MSRSYSNHPPPRDSYRDAPPPPPSHRSNDPQSWAQPPPPQQQYQQHPQQYQNYQQSSYNQPPPSQQYQQQPYHPLQGFTQPPPPPSSSSRYLPPPFPSSSSWQPQDRRDAASNGYGYQPPQQNWRDAPPPPPPQQSYGRTNGFGGGGGRDHREEQAPPPRHMRWDGDGRADDDRRPSGYDRDSWGGGGGGDRYRGGGGEREREYRRDDPPSRDPYQQPSQYDRGPPGLPSRPPQPYQQSHQSYQHPHSSQQQYSNSDHRQHQQNHSQGGGGGSTRSRSPTRRPTKPPGLKRRTTPTPEYEAFSLQPSSRIGPNPPKKLLLLDLNGTLIYRARASSQMSYRKRPYLDALMSYLKEKWEVGVWSSATPENVERMLLFLGMKAGQQEIAKVEESSEKGKKKDEMVLRVIWARDTLGLSDGEYNSKTITIKNLDVIFAYLNSPESLPPPKKDRFPRAPSKTRVYSPLNTFLLDDSHIKTSCQPYNHLPVPDYDSVLSVASARFFRAAERQKAPPSLPNPDEIRMSDDDADEEMKPATPPPAAELVEEIESVGVDRSLLAVVGILERARGEESLIGWARSGGLIPDLDDPNGWWLVDDTPKTSTSAKPPASDSASTSDPTANIKRSRRPKVKKAKKTQIDATNLSAIFPPSSSSSNPITSSSTSTPLEVSSETPWYSSPPHVEFWVRRGVDVLSGMGVDLSHGVDLAFLESMEPKGSGRSSLRSSRNRAPQEKEEDGRGMMKVGAEGEEDEEMKVERELLGDSSF